RDRLEQRRLPDALRGNAAALERPSSLGCRARRAADAGPTLFLLAERGLTGRNCGDHLTNWVRQESAEVSASKNDANIAGLVQRSVHVRRPKHQQARKQRHHFCRTATPTNKGAMP